MFVNDVGPLSIYYLSCKSVVPQAVSENAFTFTLLHKTPLAMASLCWLALVLFQCFWCLNVKNGNRCMIFCHWDFTRRAFIGSWESYFAKIRWTTEAGCNTLFIHFNTVLITFLLWAYTITLWWLKVALQFLNCPTTILTYPVSCSLKCIWMAIASQVDRSQSAVACSVSPDRLPMA